MATEAAARGRPIDGARAAAHPRPTIRNAGRLLAVAGLLGIVGQLLFFEVGIGLNLPIAIGLLLAGGWLLRRPGGKPALADSWLPLASVLFAAFVAVRADPTIAALDVVASLGLAGAALGSFAGRRVVARSFGALVDLALGAIAWFIGGAIAVMTDAARQARWGSLARGVATAGPVLRGIALAIPVTVVFVALFSSADAVFAELVDDLVGWRLDVGDAAWRAGLAVVLAWLAAGSIGLASVAPSPEEPATVRTRVAWRPGTTELLIVVIAVATVFAVFVALQAAYLFGGLDTLAAVGLTYAEYARRGFFELVAVAILAGALIVSVDRLAPLRTRALVAAAMSVTLMTGLVLISAVLRMRLYQEAYGWTELRLYVLSTIVLLGLGVVALLAALATDRVHWIGHVLIGAALVIGIGLNLLGPARFITEQNVARTLDPSLVPANGSTGLDVFYAVSLGDDGVPDLLRALPALPTARADELRSALRFRLDQLRSESGDDAWQAWNLGRSTALTALEEADAGGRLR